MAIYSIMGDNDNGDINFLYGVMVKDKAGEAAVKQMLSVALLCAFCQIIYTTCQVIVTGESVPEIVYMICLLMIPYCGYRGAKNRVRSQVSLFRTCNLVQAVVFITIAANKFLDLKRAEEACYACSTERINKRGPNATNVQCEFIDWLGSKRFMDDDTLKDCVNLSSPVAEYVSIFLCVFLFPVLCVAAYTGNKLLKSSIFIAKAGENAKFAVGTIEEIVVEAKDSEFEMVE